MEGVQPGDQVAGVNRVIAAIPSIARVESDYPSATSGASSLRITKRDDVSRSQRIDRTDYRHILVHGIPAKRSLLRIAEDILLDRGILGHITKESYAQRAGVGPNG